MTELFDLQAVQSLWIAIILLIFFYFAIVFGIGAFLKRSMVGILDPLNVTLFFTTGPGLVGFLLAPFLTERFSESYFLILFFLCIWLLIMRLAGSPQKVEFKDKMSVDFQFSLLALTILIIIVNVIVNMIIPGTIPLLTEGGVYSRFDATQNSRLLSWLSMGLAPMPGLIFALTQNARIRRFAIFAVILQTASGLLFASKGAIVSGLFILINAMFVAKVRNETVRFNKMRKVLVILGAATLCLIPVYFVVIGFGGQSSASIALAIRFLGGYDQLIYASQFDLLRGAPSGSLLHINLIEYQFMPVFKAIFSARYDYSSIGQYVIEMITGQYIDGPFTFPNSNLILETVFTSGTYLGFAAFVVELICFYRCRITVLKKPVTPFSLIFLYGFFFEPLGLFSSGQEWITEMLVVGIVICLALMLSILWRSVKNTLRIISLSHAH